MEVVILFIIITSCSAGKDDSVPIQQDSRVTEPFYYLDDQDLLSALEKTRKKVLENPQSQLGSRTTYAFDLYTRTGRTYKNLLRNSYHSVRDMLLEGDSTEWFFLSGGYGIAHALEKVRKYQATFSQSIAHQKDIPYTGKLWNGILTPICDAILSKFGAEYVYVLGSQVYTQYIKKTRYWHSHNNIRMFESTGLGGSLWLSPLLNKLLNSILNDGISNFNATYPKFIKQE